MVDPIKPKESPDSEPLWSVDRIYNCPVCFVPLHLPGLCVNCLEAEKKYPIPSELLKETT